MLTLAAVDLASPKLRQLHGRLAERIAELQAEMASAAFHGRLAEARARSQSPVEAQAAAIRARGEDRSLPRDQEQDLLRRMADVAATWRSRTASGPEEPPDRPPALAPPDPKRLPMWRGAL